MTRLFAGTPFDRPPHCEGCDLPEDDCQCPPSPEPEAARIPPHEQTAKLSIEKRRRGKTATVIRGLPAEGNDLPDLLRQLRSLCGAGGSLQDDAVEIQGRHLDRIRSHLQSMGFQVKG